MLIIDIGNQRVHNNPHFDLDVVILKGASDKLVSNLTALTLKPQQCCGSGKCDSKKVALGGVERISKTVPQSIFAGGNGSFSDVYAKLSQALDGYTSPAKQSNASFANVTKSRKALQAQLAKVLTSNAAFVEALRLATQGSTTFNPNANSITTLNIKAVLALYAHYSLERTFSSPEGATTISDVANVSTDTIARLATELALLRRIGLSSNTRYSVSKPFGTLVLRTLQENIKFHVLANQADLLQDQIDGLATT